MFTPDEIKIANKTSRSTGAVGQKAIVPRLVAETVSPEDNLTLLDFGAGKTAIHTQALREQGFNVTAYEFGDNINPKLHDINALKNKYDVIYASNVINVQSSEEMLQATINQIQGCMKLNSIVIVNYPTSPRKLNWSMTQMINYLNQYFVLDRVKNQPNVFMLTKIESYV